MDYRALECPGVDPGRPEPRPAVSKNLREAYEHLVTISGDLLRESIKSDVWGTPEMGFMFGQLNLAMLAVADARKQGQAEGSQP